MLFAVLVIGYDFGLFGCGQKSQITRGGNSVGEPVGISVQQERVGGGGDVFIFGVGIREQTHMLHVEVAELVQLEERVVLEGNVGVVVGGVVASVALDVER